MGDLNKKNHLVAYISQLEESMIGGGFY